MDQAIFRLGLSVPATSLYLLMDSLSDSGAPLTREMVSRFWNTDASDLDLAFTELVARRVAGAEANGAWFVRPGSEWV